MLMLRESKLTKQRDTGDCRYSQRIQTIVRPSLDILRQEPASFSPPNAQGKGLAGKNGKEMGRYPFIRHFKT